MYLKSYIATAAFTTGLIAAEHPNYLNYYPGFWIKNSFFGIIWPYTWYKFFKNNETNYIFYNMYPVIYRNTLENNREIRRKKI